VFQDDPQVPNCVRIHLKVVPGSRRDQIVGPLGDRLKVKVSAPPEDGRANKAVCELLGTALGINPRDVEVVAGHSSPEKTVRVRGRSAADITAALAL
jgi:uncharacterized protein (TIGR00251 family)